MRESRRAITPQSLSARTRWPAPAAGSDGLSQLQLHEPIAAPCNDPLLLPLQDRIVDRQKRYLVQDDQRERLAWDITFQKLRVPNSTAWPSALETFNQFLAESSGLRHRLR